jgi:hypothetical protein
MGPSRTFNTYKQWQATLDQGLPVFYDCLDEVMDESFSEQEDSYFQDEPRKSEVVKCYYEVFVNDNNNDDDDNNSEDNTSYAESNDNGEDSKVEEEEKDQPSEEEEEE